jgi:hypothetical protein
MNVFFSDIFVIKYEFSVFEHIFFVFSCFSKNKDIVSSHKTEKRGKDVFLILLLFLFKFDHKII